MGKIIKLGIIGMGNMGSAHANCVLENNISRCELTAICDISEERLSDFKNKYPSLQCFSDYNELLKSGLVDAVIIAVPHRLHTVIASAAFENGINVLVEKPVDISITAAKKLNDIAQKSGKVFGIMFNQRTNPLFKKVREIVKSGELGELKRSVWIITNWYRTQAYYDSGDWRATWSGEGGGVLLNQAPHQLDIWQWICGMPNEITAFCDIAKYHNIEVEDDATVFARYENGATGLFVTTTGEYPGTNRLEISGSLGKLVLENGKIKMWKIKKSERELCFELKENFPTIPTEYIEIEAEGEETAHKGILQNFIDSIAFGTELLASGYEGINELTISNAAYLSAWKGETVKIPFNNKEFDSLLLELQKNSTFKENRTLTSSSDSHYKKRWQVNW